MNVQKQSEVAHLTHECYFLEGLHEHRQRVNYRLENYFVTARRTKDVGELSRQFLCGFLDPIVTRSGVRHAVHPQNRSISPHEVAEVLSRSTRKTRRLCDSSSKSQPGTSIIGLFSINVSLSCELGL